MNKKQIMGISFLALFTLPYASLSIANCGSKGWCSEPIEENSNYLIWSNNEVGAVSHAIRWTEPAVPHNTPQYFEYGCSAGCGDEWENNPQPGTYTPEFYYFRTIVTATEVTLVFENETTTSGDPFDVTFEDLYKFKQDASKGELSTITYILETLFDLFIGLIFEGDWSLDQYTTLSNQRETFTTYCYDSSYGNMAGMDGEIQYKGDFPDGTDHVEVTIEVQTTGYFYVEHEPGSKDTAYSGSISRTDEFIVEFEDT
jgi:hypothetical protein